MTENEKTKLIQSVIMNGNEYGELKNEKKVFTKDYLTQFLPFVFLRVIKMNNNNQNYSDILNALSLILAVENLSENRQQSQYNDVHKANDEQAELLLNKINDRFAKQDIILKEHTELLNKILDKLGE